MSFTQRLAEIKKQRMNSEQLIINTNIQKLNEFDIEQRLFDNQEDAVDDLSSKRKWALFHGSVLTSSLALIGLGAATIASGPLLGAAALASVASMTAGATMGATLLKFTKNLNETLMTPFKSAEKHNFDMVKNELAELSKTVKTAKVNKKTTAKDIFLATKETIKDTYRSIKLAFFAPKSEEEVSFRINQMKELQEKALKGSIGKLKTV